MLLADKFNEISVSHAVLALGFWFSCIESSNALNISLL